MVGADTINTILASMDSKLTSDDINIETLGDGTVDVDVKNDTYTINLNHTHEGMAKLVKCTEATLPQTMADDTIYVQVDNLTTPQEIEALHIFGLEFTGGGLPAGTPAITKPSGTSINLGENSGSGVSKTIEIKANGHITGDLTVALASNSDLSFDTTNLPSGVTYNSGAGTLTIEQLPAIQGVNITVVYSGSGGAEIDGGIIITGGGASPKSITVVVEAGPVVIGGIKLTGTQWLKTDYCPGPNTEFSLKCKFTENSNTNSSGYDYTHCYFLCCPYDGNYRFSFYNGQAGDNPNRFLAANENNSSSQQLFVGSSAMQTDESYLNLVKGASSFTLEFLAGGVTPTQYTATLPLKTTTMPQPLEIGHLSSKTSGEGIYGVYYLTIYELKIYEGGRTDDYLVRHYVPRTIDNVPGLYDLKTHGFISSETNTDVDIVQ